MVIKRSPDVKIPLDTVAASSASYGSSTRSTPAATGVDENSNTEVGVFLEALDVIKQRAGVSELILPTTAGDRKAIEQEAIEAHVLTIVGNRPGVGSVDLREGVRQIMRTASNGKIDAAVARLIGRRRLHVKAAPGNAKPHHLGPDPEAVKPDPFS